MKKCKSKSISSFFKHKKALMKKQKKANNKFKEAWFDSEGKIKEKLVDVDSELLKRHNDEKSHDDLQGFGRHKIGP